MLVRYFLSCTFFLALSACASYEAQSLLDEPAKTDVLQNLTVNAASMPFPALAAHRFDASDGLDSIEVAMLAVVNNPDLLLARNDATIAHAQAFSAGLLPEPQLSISHDVANTVGPGLVSARAYAFGLSYDVNALLLHASIQNMLESESHKTDLNLLWQEWQVIAQVRLLFVKLTQAEKLMAILDDTQHIFVDRVQRTQSALNDGLLTSEAVTPNLVALQDVQRQVFELKRQISQNSHDLNTLLGLAPNTELRLQGEADQEQADASIITIARTDLARRRPDLLALAAGYQAQDQRYRSALLAQFPALNIGFTHARDASGMASSAVGITLSIPVLNRNRGNIAIEKATRQKLFNEYQQRLQASDNAIERILSEQTLNLTHQTEIDAAIIALRSALARSESAFRANSVDALIYCSAQAALLAKQLERISLQQAILEQGVALQTLLGTDTLIFLNHTH